MWCNIKMDSNVVTATTSLRVAEIKNGRVNQVILAPSIEWCVQNLGGVWVVDENDDASLGNEYDTESDAFRVSMDDIRQERNKRLTESDKFAAVDYPYATEGVRQAYLEYRQALRDLPANTTEDPENLTWPEAPKTTPPGPMDILRRKRNEMLRRTDHLAFPDYPHLSDQVRADWMDYRQALRDLPQTAAGDAANAAWPSEPTYQ